MTTFQNPPDDAPASRRRPAVSWRRPALSLTFLLALAVVHPAHARADDTPAERLREIKQLQREYLMRPARELLEEEAPGDSERPGKSQRPISPFLRVWRPIPGTPESPGLPAGGERILSEANITLSDRTGDSPGQFAAQDEPSVAAFGDKMLAAWNDGEGYVTGGPPQGFGISTNGGASFTDGDTPPTGLLLPGWYSDPVVAVNEKTGEFYYCALIYPTFIDNGVGIMPGTFTGTSFAWGTPAVARTEPRVGTSGRAIDKCWMAADSLTGNLYVVYTEFAADSDWIVFQRSTNHGRDWSDPLRLTPNSVSSQVQGARVAVGPEGYVYVVWKEINVSGEEDYFRIRRSTDGGVTFGPQHTVAAHYDNFGTGAPGFNRAQGITFPSIAVDRTDGPRRGRIYVAWNESTNWYDAIATLGNGGTVNEVESNDAYDDATPFAPGVTLSGTLDFADEDDYSFVATRGLTYVFWCNQAPAATYVMRIACTDQTTQLALGGDPEQGGKQGLLVWTAPSNGTYYLRVIYGAGTGGSAYTVRTGIDPSSATRGRDSRDIFVASSADGATWSTPVRVNDDQPWFDDWLPEVAVAGNGTVYTMWYDWRDAPEEACGGVSHVYLSRSDDGGTTWGSLGPLTDVQTAWSETRANAQPNQGDYLSLFGNRQILTAAWSDGRAGDPDIFGATIDLSRTQVAVENVFADTSSVRITWRASSLSGPVALTASVYRKFGVTAYDSIGTITSDGAGAMSFEDHDVTSGVYYQYELRIEEGGVSRFVGFTSVLVPVVTPEFALGLPRPNPTAREVYVNFTLPNSLPAKLELIDLSGRIVRSQEVGMLGPGDHLVNVAAGPRLRPGLYFIRLTQGGTTRSQRVSVVP